VNRGIWGHQFLDHIIKNHVHIVASVNIVVPNCGIKNRKVHRIEEELLERKLHGFGHGYISHWGFGKFAAGRLAAGAGWGVERGMR
jgi:hypothetical protein